MPWRVIPDAVAELFQRPGANRIGRGQAAMSGPRCGKPITVPRDWHGDAVDGTGLPLCHWSQSIWDGYSPERQAEVKLRVPNVEQDLRGVTTMRKPPTP
jgi:hypothetical protein